MNDQVLPELEGARVFELMGRRAVFAGGYVSLEIPVYQSAPQLVNLPREFAVPLARTTLDVYGES